MEQLLRDICECVLDKYGMPTIKLIFTDAQCSQIRYNPYGKYLYSMTISKSWFRRGIEEIAIASLLHELAHLRHHVAGEEFGHNKDFRKLEIELLADWGLKPVGYRRAYYSILQTTNGKFSWRR